VKTIELTQDQLAIVDDEDFDWLSQWKWSAAPRPLPKSKNIFVAVRAYRTKGTRKRVYMHRQVMGIYDEREVDHKDNNPLNNQRNNLRICTRTQNNANFSLPDRSTSGYKGVSWHKLKNKYRAAIGFQNRTIPLLLLKHTIQKQKNYLVSLHILTSGVTVESKLIRNNIMEWKCCNRVWQLVITHGFKSRGDFYPKCPICGTKGKSFDEMKSYKETNKGG
jgi:hypothetical protein